MHTRLIISLCSLALFCLAGIRSESVAQLPVNAASELTGKELFEAKCKQCHSLDRIHEAHLDKDKARDIIERMRQKPGANISPDDTAVIYRYLERYFTVSPNPPIAPAPVVPMPAR